MGAHHTEPTGAYEMYVPTPPKPERKPRPWIYDVVFILFSFAAGFLAHMFWFTPTADTPYSTPNTVGATYAQSTKPSPSALASSAASELAKVKLYSDAGPTGITAEVGTDIPAGTWRIDAISPYCIWQVYTSAGTTFVGGNAGSGKQVAVLKAGDVFESQGCGVWARD